MKIRNELAHGRTLITRSAAEQYVVTVNAMIQAIEGYADISQLRRIFSQLEVDYTNQEQVRQIRVGRLSATGVSADLQVPRAMVGPQNTQVGRRPGQLALAFGEWFAVEGQKVRAMPGASMRDRRPRDAHGWFVACAAGPVKPRRVRALPSRDNRGRFVAYPTSDAPGGYVFCCDGYCIPEDPSEQPPMIAPAAPRALPRAIARPRRIWLTRLCDRDGLVPVPPPTAALIMCITRSPSLRHEPTSGSPHHRRSAA
jgi:hypothetical protein